MVDIPNRIGKNGLIYFPDFCQLVLDQIREDEKNGEEDFRRNMPVIVEYKKTQDVVCVLHNPETNVLRAALSSGYF